MNNLRVIRLQIENFLGVKAVNITPAGDVIRIEGKNGAGKSSVIDSIWAAIGGSKESPDHPIRNGESNASIIVDLGEILVERKFTEKGSYLHVKNKDGLSFPNPQKTLDELFSRVSMDPQEFIEMKSKERCDFLLELTGQRDKIEKIEAKKKEIYDERTLINRETKTIQGKLAGAPEDEDIAEKSVSDLMLELAEAREKDDTIQGFKDEITQINMDAGACETRIASIKEEIRTLVNTMHDLETTIKEEKNKKEHLEKMVSDAPPSQVPALEAEIMSAEEHNSRVRAIQAAREIRKELAASEGVAKTLTRRIDELDKDKLDILKSSSLPIKNISIDDGMLLIGDIPFDDLATSEQLKVSMQIGISINPKLRVIRIHRGSELDSDSMATVKTFAKKNDCQVWLEVVSDIPQEGIFVQDGEIKTEPVPA